RRALTLPTRPSTGECLRKLGLTIWTARRLKRDLHPTLRAIFFVGFFFLSRLRELVDRANKQEDCARHNEKINQERNEVAVIPSNRSSLRGVSGSVERRRAVFGRSQNDELV